MQPYDGIKVLDTTHVLAGPFAAYQLAVLGADVLKVEHPTEPDQVRLQGPSRELNHACMGTMFLTQASNKRSLTLNFKNAEARDILRKLVADADVFIENYRPGALKDLGLGFDDLVAINPRLIYCSISAYGQDGPRGWQTGYDNILQASSGLMHMTGTPETSPLKVGSPAIDYATGAMAAFAISSALFQREKTGKGQYIDLSMLDASLILLGSHITAYAVAGVDPGPVGNDYPFATLGCYKTADGDLMIGAANLRQQRRLWDILGHPEMIKESNDQRLDDKTRERALLEEILLTRTAQEWEDWLEAGHIPAGRVRKMSEALADPQLSSRAILHNHARIEGMNGTEGEYSVPVAAFRYAHGGPSVETAPPRMGEHNDSVLTSLGYGADDIARLRQDGAI